MCIAYKVIICEKLKLQKIAIQTQVDKSPADKLLKIYHRYNYFIIDSLESSMGIRVKVTEILFCFYRFYFSKLGRRRETNKNIIWEFEHFNNLCVLHLTKFYYPRATHCGGDIVTLLWFRPCVCVCVSVCPSRFDLVNTIETESLHASSSNLADMFTMTRG